MTARMLLAATIAVVVTAIATGTAGAVIPVDGGDAGGTTIAINSGAGDQTELHGGGDDTIDGGLGFDTCTAGLGANQVTRCEAVA